MSTDQDPTLVADGVKKVRQLLEIAKSRLQERNLRMAYNESVVDWLINRTRWRESLNPIRTLDGYWHQHIGQVIEQLILDKGFTEGGLLSIKTEDSPNGVSLRFQVDTTTTEN